MKHKILLTLLLAPFCFASCQQYSPIESVNLLQEEEILIPITDNNREIVQIIKISIKNEKMEVLATYPLYYPLESLDESELAYLEYSICSKNTDLCKDLKLRFSLSDIFLPADKSKISWKENLSWCSGTTCYGLNRIVSYIPNTQTKQILIELPHHADLLTSQSLSTFRWSPNNLVMAFAHLSDSSLRMKNVDSETGLIIDIGDGGTPFDWSPDGKYLASTLYSSMKNQWEINIIGLDGTKTVFPLIDLKAVGSLDWSPDGSKIAISAWDGKRTGEAQFNIYILDLDGGNIFTVSPKDDFSYGKLQWSPDGKMLGTLSHQIGTYNQKQLLFLDTTNWEVMSNVIAGDGDPEWQWSKTSQSVLLRITNKNSVKIVIYNVFEQNSLFVDFPKYILREIENGNIELGFPAW